ncbi:MAG: Lrp/AsnC ligand binding domain-containing protein [Nitrososphaerota archaeon]|nr:Lrp/AsnC ligand binding domain-containing protein [Candidatus Calditenuaceae archaeon]MDW8073069.1 Lrp/AsnC ligand binding domain-containing protein [Nitrososphaerota archaeon]
MKAFILGSVGKRSELIECLHATRRIQLVREAYLIFGTADIIAKVEVNTIEQINSVLDTLYQNGVVDTNTLIVNSAGLNFERQLTTPKKKCAYTFIKIRRPAAPRLWDRFLQSIEHVMEAYEIFGIYDVIVGVGEDAKSDFFNSYFRRLWLLTEINMNSTTTMFTVDI